MPGTIEFEVQRLHALRAIVCSFSELKCLAAARRFEIALERHALALKYGYSPAQPRVPKGNEDGGPWTATDADGNPLNKRPSENGRIRLAGGWPSNDPPEPLDDEPKNLDKEPEASAERTSILKYIARRAVETGVSVSVIVGTTTWLLLRETEIVSYNDAPASLEDLRKAASTPAPGYDIHHVVERTSAEEHGFAREAINHPTNLVRVPRLKHQEINAWYQTRNADYGGLSPREYLSGRSWGVREAVGLRALKLHGVLK